MCTARRVLTANRSDLQSVSNVVNTGWAQYKHCLTHVCFLACLLDKCFGAKAFYKVLLADRLDELYALDTS